MQGRILPLLVVAFVASASMSSAQGVAGVHGPIPAPCPCPECGACKVCVPKPTVKKHIIYGTCPKEFCLPRCGGTWCGLFSHCCPECIQCDRPRVKHVLMKLAVDEPTVKCVVEERPCQRPACVMPGASHVEAPLPLRPALGQAGFVQPTPYPYQSWEANPRR